MGEGGKARFGPQARRYNGRERGSGHRPDATIGVRGAWAPGPTLHGLFPVRAIDSAVAFCNACAGWHGRKRAMPPVWSSSFSLFFLRSEMAGRNKLKLELQTEGGSPARLPGEENG